MWYMLYNIIIITESLSMFNYLLPVENFHGGDGWKMPVTFSIDTDLDQLKKTDLVRYIKIMILAFQKAHKAKSFDHGFTALLLEAEYSQMRLNPDFWKEQSITDEHMTSDEVLKLSVIDNLNITYDIHEPERLKQQLDSVLKDHIQHIEISASDLEIIIDD